MENNIKGCCILTFASLIWGTVFITQKFASDLIDPITFISCRFFASAIVLLPMSLIIIFFV